MARRYPPEVHEFIAENVHGRTLRELTDIVNERFGLNFTPGMMKSYKTNHKLRSGTPSGVIAGRPTEKYPQKVIDYINENYCGVGPMEMAARLKRDLGESYTAGQIKGYYGNHKLNSGVSGRFEKGHVSHNKGKKGICAPGCEKSWFRKGSVPYNKLPIGTVLMKTDGYLWRKIGEGARDWKQEHILIWEAANGPIPDGYCITFRDSNRTNCCLENLAIISMAENSQMNRRKLRSSDPDVTDVGIMVARVRCAALEKTREIKKKKGQKRI